MSSKNKSQFRIKTQIGSFICNNRSAGEEADKLLKEMNFNLSFTWSYEPLGNISILRVENKTTPYTHTQRPKIERYVNHQAWGENTLEEAEEHLVSTSTSKNHVLQERATKR